MARDRYATRAAILESATTLVAQHGVGGFGVNALAQAAGCDKVLIYRYFGGLDGVLEAVGAERAVWPKVALEAREGEESLADALESLALEEWAALSSGALMLGASGAEIEGDNPLARAVATQRRERHTEIVESLRQRYRVPPYVDLPALLEFLSAALTLFALRAGREAGEGDPAAGETVHSAQTTVDPSTPAGWRRIEKTVAAVTRALLDA